jgi:hypothetical protein
MRAVLLVAALSAVSAVASAQDAASFMTGNELKVFCRDEGAYGRGICSGFASAVSGVVATEHFAGWRACFPDGVTRGQVSDIMVKFLDDHPEKLHLTAASLTAHAFAEAFPCPK